MIRFTFGRLLKLAILSAILICTASATTNDLTAHFLDVGQSDSILLQFNGKNVTDSRHLKLMVAEAKPDSTVPVKILRDGSSKTIEVTVRQLPGTEQLARAETPNGGDSGTLNGVGVESLNAQSRQQFQVPEKVKGAVVTEVRPDSAAAEAGLQPGDVIEEIDRHPVANADEAVHLTEKAKDKHTLLRIWRNGGSHYLVVDESKLG